jgi:hypothetical protein
VAYCKGFEDVYGEDNLAKAVSKYGPVRLVYQSMVSSLWNLAPLKPLYKATAGKFPFLIHRPHCFSADPHWESRGRPFKVLSTEQSYIVQGELEASTTDSIDLLLAKQLQKK